MFFINSFAILELSIRMMLYCPPKSLNEYIVLASALFIPREGHTADQHDAYVAASWLRQVDMEGRLGKFLKPSMLSGEYPVVRIEGWILGVM
jgi:hypothetical protein